MPGGARSERVVAIFDADGRRLNAGLDRMEKKVNHFSRALKKSMGALKSVAGFGGIGAAVGGAFAVADVAGEVLDFERSLARLGVAANGAYGDLSGIRTQINAVSRVTGVNRQEILNSAASYLALTGDAKGAAAQMETFARVQVATGAAMDDVSASAAAMVQNLKIDPADMEKAFSVLVASGKAGAVELKDMAGLLAELAPLAARFDKGAGIGGLNTLSAALQLSRQGFGSAAEAATGLQSLMGAIVQHAGKLEKAGITVFDTDKDGTKRLRSFQQIVEDIGNSKLAKDPTKLIEALGRKEALSAFIQLTKVRGAWNAIALAAEGATDIARDYGTMQESSAMRIAKAWELVKLRLAETFTPERIEAFARGMEAIVLAAQDLFGWLEKVADVMGRWEKPSRKQQLSAADDAAEKLVELGATEEQVLKRPWELPLEMQYAITGRDLDVANAMPAARRRRAAWEAGGVFAEQLEAAGRPLYDMDEIARQNEEDLRRFGAVQSWRSSPGERIRSMFGVRISFDRDGNLKAAMDDHRSQRR